MTAIFLFLSEDIISYLPRKKTVFAKIALFFCNFCSLPVPYTPLTTMINEGVTGFLTPEWVFMSRKTVMSAAYSSFQK